MRATDVAFSAQAANPPGFVRANMSSAYSVMNFTWNTGTLLGPVISAALVKHVGYQFMCVGIAVIALVDGGLAVTFFAGKKER